MVRAASIAIFAARREVAAGDPAFVARPSRGHVIDQDVVAAARIFCAVAWAVDDPDSGGASVRAGRRFEVVRAQRDIAQDHVVSGHAEERAAGGGAAENDFARGCLSGYGQEGIRKAQVSGSDGKKPGHAEDARAWATAHHASA